MKKYIIILVSLFIILITNICSANISVSSYVDKSKILIGDTILFTVQAEYSKKMRVEFGSIGANLGKFEIKEYYPEKTIETDTKIIKEIRAVISIYESGKHTIPAIEITYYNDESDTNPKYIKTSNVDINVKKIPINEKNDIKDITGPEISIPDYNKVYILTGTIVAIIVILIILFVFIKKRKIGSFISISEPELTSFEKTMELLNKLKNSNYLENSDVKKFGIDLSYILRFYLTEEYNINIIDMSTFEIKYELEKIKDIDDKLILDILEKTDLIKFAKFKLPDKDLNYLLIKTEKFIITNYNSRHENEKTDNREEADNVESKPELVEQNKEINEPDKNQDNIIDEVFETENNENKNKEGQN